MAKRKKLKLPKRQKKFRKMEDPVQAESDSECDVLDMIDVQELENIKNTYSTSEVYKTSNGQKMESSDSSEEEMCETDHRNRKVIARNKYPVLPLKKKHEFIPQSKSDEEEVNENSNEQPDSTSKPETIEIIKPLSLTEKLAERHKIKVEMKLKIGRLSSCIVESPESNTASLKALTILLKNKDVSANMVIGKLAMLSLLEVYKDIIPSYKLRNLSDMEKKQKMKKETRQLTGYEESLLRYYRQYLEFLEKLLQTTVKLEKLKNHNIFTERKRSIGLVAIKCLNELLVTHPHFNYNSNIINVLVPLMTHKNKEISKICCTSMSNVFKDDKLGEVSLLIVKRILKLIKERQGSVSPEVLRTFLHLNIKQSDIIDNVKEGKDIKKIRANLARMSRRERKRNKKMQNLEKELKAAEVEESKSQKVKIKSEILKHIFHVYFRVLKSSTRLPLLTPVLEGLSKFAHLINIEFFDDLIVVLHKLIETNDLTNHEVLHSLYTVFIVLSGQGSLLNIDPQGFFKPLYKILLDLHVGKTSEDFPILLPCLDIMIIKRLKINTLQRTLAFLKRLGTVCLQSSSNSAIAILSMIRTLMISCSKSDILLDIDNNLGSGIYMPELEDLEHCNAHSSVLWELHLLNSHYHPAVHSYAHNILNACPLQGNARLPTHLVKLKADELYAKYDPTNIEMKM